MRPLTISIVVPSFNQGAFIGDALASIRDQHYPCVETIVIDGGSTDRTVDVVRSFASHLAYWTSEPDRGQTDALIKGFARASGDIQCWLNSDDMLMPHACADVAAFFARRPDVDVVFGDAEWITVDGALLKTQHEIPFNRFIWLNTYNYLPGMSVFWRRSIFERCGGLDARFDLAMDADLWIRFSDAGARFAHVPRVWSRMRFYAAQKNQRLRHMSDEEDAVIRSRYYAGERAHARAVRRVAASALRVAIRAVTGCYGIAGVRNSRRTHR